VVACNLKSGPGQGEVFQQIRQGLIARDGKPSCFNVKGYRQKSKPELDGGWFLQ